jgi:flagellar basal-body rod protein FlgB
MIAHGGPVHDLIDRMSLLDTTQLSLESAMRGSMLDQTYLANNLANADTPGFQAQTINFQGELQSAMQAGRPPGSVSFSASPEGGVSSADGNGVSAEQTSAQIAENGLLYQDLSHVAAAREQIMLTAIGQGSGGIA